MLWASSGCGKYVVGIEWVWQICCGHRVGMANMVWALSGCGKYVVGIEWVWQICCGNRVGVANMVWAWDQVCDSVGRGCLTWCGYDI